MSSRNFECTAEGQIVNVTTSSTRITLPAGSSDVMVDNRGSSDLYILAGASGVVATPASLRVPANSAVIYGKGSATHLALIGAGATTAAVYGGTGA